METIENAVIAAEARKKLAAARAAMAEAQAAMADAQKTIDVAEAPPLVPDRRWRVRNESDVRLTVHGAERVFHTGEIVSTTGFTLDDIASFQQALELEEIPGSP